MRRYLRILRQQRRPLRFLVSRLLRSSGLWRLVLLKFDGYRLKLHPSSLALALWVDKRDRKADCDVIRKLLRAGETYVDAGANIGQLAVEAALAVGPSGAVYAFEAHPQVAGYLRENIALNSLDNVRIAQVALGDHFGWVSFSDTGSDDANKVAETGGIPVPMVPLYCLVPDAVIDLLKIDVEGYEKFVLLGLGDRLAQVSVVYFEAMDSHMNALGYSFSDIFSILDKDGLSVFQEKDGALRRVRADDQFPDCTNLFAARDEEIFSERMGLPVEY